MFCGTFMINYWQINVCKYNDINDRISDEYIKHPQTQNTYLRFDLHLDLYQTAISIYNLVWKCCILLLIDWIFGTFNAIILSLMCNIYLMIYLKV